MTDFLAPTRERRAELEARLEHAEGPLEEARLLLATGRHDAARQRVPALLERGADARVLAARILFAVADYERLATVVEALAAAHGDYPDVRRLAYRWWFLTDDLERVERAAAGDADVAGRLAAARLKAQLHELAAAQEAYEAALGEVRTEEEEALALHGLGVVLYRRCELDAALVRLREALALTPLDPDLLTGLSETLIRLSRTGEAIAALELAVELAPWHERAHYFLGNGYARQSYTQLAAARPAAFASGAGRAALARADERLAAGDRRSAAAAFAALRRHHPGWADVAVRLGSLAFAERRYAAARRHFRAALELCGDYGRAHNGLARTLEAERLRRSVHRPLYKARFAAAPTPRVAGLERYVLGYQALEPRHRKQVALAVAPWARYVPVLLEAGATHYVKPLYQRLSETPEQYLLADQRIAYDSRLWDDVRGCGGYHTVTGVEDVERTIWNGYNTVLHELTHQVHQLLPAAARRRIQELYRRAKERDEASGGEAFLSRYAGASVWEYFAEGAHALATPRRDRFDTREIVRQRLAEKDPELLELVRELMDEADLAPVWAVASVNRGSDRLRRGRTEEAVAAFRQALAKDASSEDALASLVYALAVSGRAAEALEQAERGVAAQPESAALAVYHASALWLAGRGLATAIAALRRARKGVRPEETYRVDLMLGSLAWTAGDAAASRRAYEAVLAYQADHPRGLWGLASACALAGDAAAAWERYEDAIRRRTGVVDLRADYARDLLRAGELDRARAQLDAALLLDPDDPEVLAYEALWLLARERTAEASRTAGRALELAPWSDYARLALALAARHAGNPEEERELLAPLRERLATSAPPEYVYRSDDGTYLLTHTLPAVLRAEIGKLGPGGTSNRAVHGLGPEEDAAAIS